MILNEIERAERAESFFTQGYNCSQAVALAFADLFPNISFDSFAALTSGFGGGMGRLREVCGAFSGCVLISGLLFPACDPRKLEDRTANYALVQELACGFKEVNGGSIICRELLGIGKKVESPRPSERDTEYYKARPCSKTVYNAALVLAKTINAKNIL